LAGLNIISSVAGGGKSTLIELLLKNHPELEFSVSCTTRPPRPGDIPGKTYHFLTEAEFRGKIEKGEFLEWALVHGNYYGTSKTFIEQALRQGKSVILDIDVQGAKAVKQRFSDAKTIFILPPSEEIWIRRLKERGTDSEEAIATRIANGRKELEEKDWFEYKIVNDNLEEAYQELTRIVFTQ